MGKLFLAIAWLLLLFVVTKLVNKSDLVTRTIYWTIFIAYTIELAIGLVIMWRLP